MGTYYTYGTKDKTWKEFIFSEINTEDHKILQCSIKGSVAYLACRIKTGEVYGLVLLLTTDNGDKGYKPVEESMGPFECQAPKSLIAKLSPTDSEYALKWRQACLDFADKRKVKEGDEIKLPGAIGFSFCGRKYLADVFKVRRLSGIRGLVFESPEGGWVKLSRIDKREKVFLN